MINYKREIYALAHLNLSTASFKTSNLAIPYVGADMDVGNASVATSSGDAANDSHQSAYYPDVSSGMANSSGVSEPSERDRLLRNEPDTSTARADNPVNPTAPPAELDEDNSATVSACTDLSAANSPEG